MPVTIIIELKNVSLGADLRQLLTFYRDALEECGIKLEHDKQGPKSKAAPEEPQDRKGFWAKWVLPTVESITPIKLSSQEFKLPPLALELDPPAQFLLNDYLNFLNSLLVDQGLSAKDTAKDELNSVFVLLRELLYRLVAIGLCNDSNREQDGETLMLVLERFITKVNKSKLLVMKPLIGSAKASPFMERFAREQPRWQNKIECMVLSIRRMASHKQTVSQVLTGLHKMKQAIQAHIIACLNPSLDTQNFAIDWLASTLDASEKQLLQKQDPESLAQPSHLLISYPGNSGEDAKLDAHQTRVVLLGRSIWLKDELAYANNLSVRLSGLYSLLNQHTRNYLIVSNLDLLISHGSWGPVLAGIINFSAISRLLSNFLKQCQELLPIPKELSEIVKTSAGLALIQNEYVNVEKLNKLISFQVIDLKLLDDPRLHQEIIQMLGSNLTGLVKLQSGLQRDYHFIDVDRVQALGLSEDAPRSNARLMPPPHVAESPLAKQPPLKQLPVVTEPPVVASVTASSSIKDLFFSALVNLALTKQMFDLFAAQGLDFTQPFEGLNAYNGYTALHIAASTGQRDVCSWLIGWGVDVNIPTQSGDTPMDKAAKSGQLRLLIDFKAVGGTSRHVEEQTAKLHQLINREDITSESNSVTQEHLNALAMLIREGAKVNGANQTNTACRGELPLHTLYIKGNRRLLKHFFVLGADPNLTDHNGETPLQRLLRVGKDKQRVLQFLAKHYPQFLVDSKSSQVVVPGAFFAAAPKLGAVSQSVPAAGNPTLQRGAS